MPKYRMIAPKIDKMPWQDKPQGNLNGPLWRYDQNPVIGRNPLPGVARIFNSAVMPYEGAFIGVFRGEQTNGVSYIYLGHSKDGVKWEFEPEKIQFVDEAPASKTPSCPLTATPFSSPGRFTAISSCSAGLRTAAIPPSAISSSARAPT